MGSNYIFRGFRVPSLPVTTLVDVNYLTDENVKVD